MNKLFAKLLAMPVILFSVAGPAFANWDYDFNKCKFNYYGGAPQTVIIVRPGEASKPASQSGWAQSNPQQSNKPNTRFEVGWTAGIEPVLPGQTTQNENQTGWARAKVVSSNQPTNYQSAPRHVIAAPWPSQAMQSVKGNDYQTTPQQPAGNLYVPGQNKGAYGERSNGYHYDASGTASYNY